MLGITALVIEAIGGLTSQFSRLPASETIIFDIAIILVLSAAIAFIAKAFKQPLIPAYVLTGLIIGPLVLGLVKNMDLIKAFSEIGIAFLLFTAGLEISFKKIKEANPAKIVLVGVLQVAAIFGIVYALRNFLSLSSLQSAYVGIILAFGSTMVDIKLLAERNELVTLHGRLVLGILLLQDLIAIAAIVIFTSSGFDIMPIGIAFIKLGAIIIIAILLQKLMLNRMFKFAAKSNELLLLSALATLFLFIVMAYTLNLSIVIGAFIAGVSLANSPFKIELESKVAPLRDFFAILFFVALGMQIVFSGIEQRFLLFTSLLVGALILKPLITLLLMRITKHQTRTSFLTSISLAQLSEFSLIIGAIGIASGAIDNSIFSSIILATIITMAITPYLIKYKETMYKIFKNPMSILKFLPANEELQYMDKENKEILVIGLHRMGGAMMKELMEKKEKLLIVDYNPDVISAIMKKKISCIYGDITSPELMDKINFDKLKMAISTIPDYDINLHILKKIKQSNPKTKVILTGNRISETLKLYDHGADFVITPKIIAGQKLATIIHGTKKDIKEHKRKHLRHLEHIHNSIY